MGAQFRLKVGRKRLLPAEFRLQRPHGFRDDFVGPFGFKQRRGFREPKDEITQGKVSENAGVEHDWSGAQC